MTVAFDPIMGAQPVHGFVPALWHNGNRKAIRVATLLAILGVLNLIDLAYTLFAYHIGNARRDES